LTTATARPGGMNASRPPLKIKVQIHCGDEIAMGPGKADLLDAIEREGSISGAARTMNMSYRRAWLLVDAMNRCWAEPVVATMPGRASGSGAHVTAFGHELRRLYRAIQHHAQGAGGTPEWAALSALLRGDPLDHQ